MNLRPLLRPSALILAASLLAQPALAAAEVRTADRIVAVVNKGVITQRQLSARVAEAVQQLKKQNVPLPAEAVLEQQVLDRMVNEEVLLQYATNNGIRIDDNELDRVIDRLAQQNKLTTAQFRDKLKQSGTSEQAFRETLRKQVMIDRLREREVDSKVFVSDSEVDAVLKSAVNASRTEYRLAHILVSLPDQANPQDIAKKQARANEAIALLQAGKPFAQVAASFSDAGDALSGGELGWRSAARLPAPFVAAIDPLQVGQHTPILRSANGLHILKLEEKRARGQAQMVEQTSVAHILVRTNEAVSEQDAKNRILQIRDRIQKGMPFAEAAKLYSEDGSAARGGELGWVNPGDMVPDFERAYQALKPGQLSEPVRTQFGWHLIQIAGSRQQDVGNERERNEVRQELRARKAEQAYADWMRQLRDSAYVQERLQEH